MRIKENERKTKDSFIRRYYLTFYRLCSSHLKAFVQLECKKNIGVVSNRGGSRRRELSLLLTT